MTRRSSEEANATNSLVGRREQVETLVAGLREGQSSLLLGPAGIGKTALLRAVLERARRAPADSWRGPVPLYCAQAATLKAALEGIVEGLLAWGVTLPGPAGSQLMAGQRASRLSRGTLRRLAMPCLRSGRYALLLDHVGRVGGAYAAFLEELAEEVKVPIVAAVRSLAPGEIGRLWWIGWNFRKIELPGLTAEEGRRLLTQLLARAGVALPDQEAFITRVLRAAGGNPGFLARVGELVRSTPYQLGGRTCFSLLQMDLKLRELQDRLDAEARVPLRGPAPDSTNLGPVPWKGS